MSFSSLADLSGKISQILQDIKNVGDFKLKKVELGVEISAQGGVSLIGSVKAGVNRTVRTGPYTAPHVTFTIDSA